MEGYIAPTDNNASPFAVAEIIFIIIINILRNKLLIKIVKKMPQPPLQPKIRAI